MHKTKQITWRFFVMRVLDMFFLILTLLKMILIKIIWRRIIKGILFIVFIILRWNIQRAWPSIKRIMEEKQGQFILGFILAVSILVVYGIFKGPLKYERSDTFFLIVIVPLIFCWSQVSVVKIFLAIGVTMGFVCALATGEIIALL
ncbi:MAG: hypothetical protein JXQ74_02695 [Alphaproteobacteria bacterium]|nr:hypothetical protein [Alphaproteobacteria bacterium]